MTEDRSPRAYQQPALAMTGKIRIVRAVPGSGKTWLLGEVLRCELDSWSDSIGGIAALSFTNVAGDEICRTIGHTPGHPHFVGTLDSFLFRVVVRPFVTWVYPHFAPPRLVPAEFVDHMGDNHWGFDSLHVRTGRGEEAVNVFEFVFFDKHEPCKTPSFVYRTKAGVLRTDLPLSKKVLKRKQALWRSSGRMSHSDVAYLAMNILSDRRRGREALDIIVRRFPLLLIDELQDTGRFHSSALRYILTSKRARGFVVGDPDQAIYGFNGAQPVVFDHFSLLHGSESVTMDVSDRCGERICRVATALSSTGITIRPKEGAAEGRSLLVVHDGEPRVVAELINQLAASYWARKPTATIGLLTRKNEEVELLTDVRLPDTPKLGSPPLEALYKSVVHWRAGRGRQARAAAEAALGRILFGSPNPNRIDIDGLGVAPLEWRRAIGEAVLLADHIVPGESFFEWGARVHEGVLTLLTRRAWLDVSGVKKPRMPAKKMREVRVPDILRATTASRSVQVKTVHAAKGETHHVTALYVPRPNSSAACPSTVWWSQSPGLEEERRIAFVAATRPRDIFLLCIHSETFDRLVEMRPEFVGLFEVAQVSDRDAVATLCGSVLCSVWSD